jgi:hypothetical protein
VYTSLIDRQGLRYNSGLLEFHYGDNEQPNPRSLTKFPHIMLQHTQQHINSLSLMLMRLRFPKHLARTIRADHSRGPFARTIRVYQNSYPLLAQNLVPVAHWESQYLKVIDRDVVDNSCAG